MEITCPECKKSTPLQITEGLCCEHCQTSFEKLKLAKKALITTSAALAIGGFAGLHADDFFESNRYPLAIEYSLLESCSKGSSEVSYNRRREELFAICTCALGTAQEDIDYKHYKKAPIDLAKAMEAAVKECAN
ncbi:hypothetical protein [Halopseudomonas aestusnigri]|uniref:Uncharacterized protein n=1 Tax=Halopseudomonas aestusnigri TaxID=857252 RepID=A0AAQ1GAJ8_9GAMM|nr:hypothetical protein [Halopseudomonas aestusnigri]OWL82964.1 hypothetical protein B7O88_17585 [Halopseudomonas aestusnigri]SEG74725.1 hypothetical protein SAMN05216586_1257 [Halopseudomonas aestusnigri]